MSWIYNQADYTGVVDDNYREYDFIALRAQWANNSWNAFKNNKILVAGCGYGFLVRQLMRDWQFTDVWGCDASSFVMTNPGNLEPEYFSRIVQADITVRQQLNALRSTAGLTGNQRFRAVVTEDVLPTAASEAEAQTMLGELRRISQSMAHVITPYRPELGEQRQPDGSVTYPGGVRMPGFSWYSIDEWRAIIGPGEPIYHSETGEVFQ